MLQTRIRAEFRDLVFCITAEFRGLSSEFRDLIFCIKAEFRGLHFCITAEFKV